MNPKNMILAFSPLVLFTVAGHFLGPHLVGWAALASAVLALIILIAGLRNGVKLVTAASVVVFGALAAVALLGGPTGQAFVAVFGSGVCALLIGVAMLISVVTVPFTEQYARAVVPREHWHSPTFQMINKKISLVWAGVVSGIGLSRLGYGLLVVVTGDQVGTLLRLGLSWGVPIVLVLAALRYTNKVAAADEHGIPEPSVSRPNAPRSPEARP